MSIPAILSPSIVNKNATHRERDGVDCGTVSRDLRHRGVRAAKSNHPAGRRQEFPAVRPPLRYGARTVAMIAPRAFPSLLGLTRALASVRGALVRRKASIGAVNPGPGEASGVHSVEQDAWNTGLMAAHSESSALNERAAVWSWAAAILAVLTPISAIFVG